MPSPEDPGPTPEGIDSAPTRPLEFITDPIRGASEPAGSAVGARVGRYRILELHAKGGLGEVLVAEDEELHRRVALKRMLDRHADHEDNRRRFIREAEVTAQLEHPGVAPVHGMVHDHEGRPCYAMRFIQGQTLLEAIQQFHAEAGAARSRTSESGSSLAFRQLLQRFVALCNIVAYAHSQGVIHRDIKPQNVLLGRYGETLLVDWGLAKRPQLDSSADGKDTDVDLTARSQQTADYAAVRADTDELTRAGRAVGTPQYMSPEQAAGRLDKHAPASDIYSLGATLYVLLTGRSAITGTTWVTQQEQIVRGAFPPPRRLNKGVPAALEAICLKAMSLRPEQRYHTALEMASDIEHWLADEPVSAHRDSWHTRSRRWLRHHQTLASGFTVLLITAVVALAVGLFLVNNERRRTEQAQEETRAALEAEARRRQQARQALDDQIAFVIDDLLGRQTALTEAHKQFLRKALRSYEEFASDVGTDPETRAAVAQAYFRAGRIQRRLGEHAEAERAYRQGIQRCRELVQEDSTTVRHQKELAGMLNNLGLLLADLGRKDETEVAYREALSLLLAAANAEPAEPGHREGLVRAQNNLGILLKNSGRAQEAEGIYLEALAALDRLIAAHPSPTYRQLLARTHLNLGNALLLLQRTEEAEQTFRNGVEVARKLCLDSPDLSAYQLDFAQNSLAWGAALRQLGKLSQAEDAYRNAIATYSQLATRYPTVLEYREQLALTLNNLGNALKNGNRIRDAEVALREAVAVRRQMMTAFPSIPGYREQFASSVWNLANLLYSDQRAGEAEPLFREAAAVQKTLVEESPQPPRRRVELAASYNSLGLCLVALRRTDDADKAYAEALTLRRQLVQESPATAEYHNALAGTLVNLAQVHLARRDFERVKPLLEEAYPHHQTALQARPRDAQFREFYRQNRWTLAQTLHEQKDHAGTAAAAEQLAANAARPANDAYDAVCFLAHCRVLAESDPHLSADVRAEMVQKYADRAMSLLGQAVQNGYKDLEHIKKDSDLNPLRSRPDFQELLRTLESQKAAGK